MGKAAKGGGLTPGSQMASDSSHLLSREQFVGLARRCYLDIDRALLDALAKNQYVVGLSTEQGSRYATVHLWLLHRYLQAVSVPAHPWDPWPSKRLAPERNRQLDALKDDAAVLNKAIEWLIGGALQASPPQVNQVRRRLKTFAESRPVLGQLREVLPMLRPDLRAGLRGEALLMAFVHRFLNQLDAPESMATGGATASHPTMHEEPEEPTTGPVPLLTSEELGVPSASPDSSILGPDASATMPNDALPSMDDALSVDEGSLDPSLDEAALAMSGEGAVLSRPEVKAKVAKVAEIPAEPPADGLRGALSRAREAASRRSQTIQAAPRGKPKPRSTAENPRIDEPIEEHLPKSNTGQQESLEEQVRKLNELREQYTASESWDELIKLFEEGIYLFPDTQDRKGVYLYIGAIQERRMENTDAAIKAYETAWECVPGDWSAYEALERMYAAQEDWDSLLDLIERGLALELPKDARVELELRRASLMSTALDQAPEALGLYKDMLRQSPSMDQRAEILDGVAELVGNETVDSETLLAGATVLESHWGIEAKADRLIELYEGMFDHLSGTDKRAAAEVMSRMASCYQATERLRPAFVSLVRALSFNPEREDIFIRLETLAEKLGGLRELAAIYEDDFETVLGQRHKAQLGRRLASLYSRLEDGEGARRAWQSVCDADPFDVEALMRLADLHQRAGEYTVLLETLDRLRSLAEGNDRTRLLLRIARIRTQGLFSKEGEAEDVLDMDAAVTALQDALASIDYGTPMSEAVVEYIRELMETGNESLAFQLAELLEQTFAQNGDYQSIIDTYELLVTTHLDNDEGRAEAGRLMTRIGQIHEEQLAQSEMAFLYYSKALRVDPQCDEALGRSRDLAEAEGSWEELAALYEEVLDSGRATMRDLWLKRLARLFADEMDEPNRAFRFYKELYEHHNDDEEATAFLEDYFERNEDWAGLIESLLTRAGFEGSAAARKSLLERASSLSLERLGDADLAIDMLRRILTIDPEDAQLMERLIILYRSQERLEDLAEFLSRQEELVREPELRAEIMQRRAELLAQDLGRTEEALEVLTRLRAMKPDDAQVLRLLESLFTATSRDIEAYAALGSLSEMLARTKPETEDEINDGATRTIEVDQILERMAAMAETVLESPDEAAQHYRKLLARNPDNLQAIGQLERIYEESENWSELSKILDAHIDLMQRQGESAAALVLLERQLEIAIDHTDDPELELSTLRQMIALGKGNLGMYERMADLARQQKEWALCLEANEGFIASLEDPADQAAILQEMAQIAEDEMEDKPLATTFLERALDACPDDPKLLGAMIERYRKQGRHRELSEALRKILETDESLTPDQRVRTCRELSDVLSKHLGEPRQAAGLLEQALSVVREFPDKVSKGIQDSVRRRIVHIYNDLGEKEVALDHMNALGEILRERGLGGEALARVYEDIGRTLVQLDRYEEAEKAFLTAFEEDETRIESRLGLAELHLDRESWTEAQAFLEPLAADLDKVTIKRDQGRVMAGLGRAFSGNGKAAKAVDAFKKALECDPTNAVAKEGLGE